MDTDQYLSDVLGRVIQDINNQEEPFNYLEQFKTYAKGLYSKENAL